MDIFNSIGIVIIGLILGSFGSVLLARLNEEWKWETIKGFLIGRSQCPHCHHTLTANELIPLRSYITQHGKCTYCHKQISIRYPVLEICSAVILLGTYRFIYTIMAYAIPDSEKILYVVIRGVINWFLMLLLLHDLKTQELHFPLRIGTILRSAFWEWRLLGASEYSRARAGAGIFGIVFRGIYRFGKRYVKKRFHTEGEGFGEGDIYIGILLGTLFPFISILNGIESSFNTCIYYLITIVLMSSILGIIQ